MAGHPACPIRFLAGGPARFLAGRSGPHARRRGRIDPVRQITSDQSLELFHVGTHLLGQRGP